MEPNKNHEKIIRIIQEKGPRLPMQIAEELKMNSLFVSAFLSELSNQKRIKISHLKVGGSPLYFLVGQEAQLENFQRYLHKKEVEAFLLLKKFKVLKDYEQDPSIRVALRSMRDFAFGFKRNDKIFWRYFLISENEAKKILEPQKIFKHELEINEDDESLEIGKNVKIKIIEKPKESKKTESAALSESDDSEPLSDSANIKSSLTKEHNEFKNPLVITEKKKVKKEKPKSEFVLKVINFIQNNELKIIKEQEYKTKEYNCTIKINSNLGPINFLTLAKDKKTITEGDLKKLLSNAQSIPLPALMLYNEEISKKAKEFADKYTSILKIKKISD